MTNYLENGNFLYPAFGGLLGMSFYALNPPHGIDQAVGSLMRGAVSGVLVDAIIHSDLVYDSFFSAVDFTIDYLGLTTDEL